MSTLTVATVKSNTSGPPAFQNTSGTEIGTLCRAWVNFNGTGTVAIRADFNVSSITDNGVGSYTVNFTTALADANYSPSVIARRPDDLLTGSWFVQLQNTNTMTTTQFQISVIYNPYANPSVATDSPGVYVAIFR